MRRELIILRATGLAWAYSVTLGCLYGVRLFLTVQTPSSGTGALRFRGAAEAVLRTSPMIVIMSSFFALLVIPLAAWSVGSASWNLLKKYIYVFWLVLAFYIVASGNADGLIVISGAGLIALWFLKNRKSSDREEVNLNHNARVQRPLQMLGISSDFAVFVVLTAIACALSLVLFLGNGTKVYVSEIFAIYAVACVCQALKAFHVIGSGRNANPERAP